MSTAQLPKPSSSSGSHLSLAELPAKVAAAIERQPVTDMHTHVFAPRFGTSPDKGALMLWGIDELVTYHYLVAELYRVVSQDDLPYEKFWAMSRSQQADVIWKHLFVERSPISEAGRGVLTTLNALGLDPNEKTLEPYRKWYAQQEPSAFVDQVMQSAGVDCITMTNEVFSAHERALWKEHADELNADTRFKSVLRLDALLVNWSAACQVLTQEGYKVGPALDQSAIGEAQRFLRDWIARMKPAYIAASLGPDFRYPLDAPVHSDAHSTDAMLDKVILPVLAEAGLPLALMIGAQRGLNSSLGDAADGVGLSHVRSVANLCAKYPKQKFLLTMLARENQHELCVTARKFGNLMIFGCWWFLNNPSLIEEITRMRIELLGTSFVPQHSDARILDQLLYKWRHSRAIIAKVLTDKYRDIIEAGYHVTDAHLQRDAALLLRDNYRQFVGQ